MRVGIDFGTSNSSAAVYDGRLSRLLPLDPAARDPRVMRSLLYLARDGGRAAGQQALDRFNDGNVGHTVKLKRVQVGVLENVFSEVGRVYTDIFVWLDENEPGRLFKSLKMELPNSAFRGTGVYGKGYTPEELVAELLIEIRQRIEAAGGEAIERVVFGRPVHYAADAEADLLAESRSERVRAGHILVQDCDQPRHSSLCRCCGGFADRWRCSDADTTGRQGMYRRREDVCYRCRGTRSHRHGNPTACRGRADHSYSRGGLLGCQASDDHDSSGGGGSNTRHGTWQRHGCAAAGARGCRLCKRPRHRLPGLR